MTSTETTNAPAGATVHLLTINHDHGTDTSVHATRESAVNGLESYVLEWWEIELGDSVIPDGAQERIDAYFGQVGEDYNIVETTIQA